jgi:hypothetical protein
MGYVWDIYGTSVLMTPGWCLVNKEQSKGTHHGCGRGNMDRNRKGGFKGLLSGYLVIWYRVSPGNPVYGCSRELYSILLSFLLIRLF